jgi:hypothetical protein
MIRARLALALALLLAHAAGAAAADVVDVHADRVRIWSGVAPTNLEGLDRAKALARQQELATRGKVLEDLTRAMAGQNLAPPVNSGTPPHIGNASGVLTDIDQTYKTQAELEAAKRWFRERGYTVVDKLPNGLPLEDAFTVKELDYSGFTARKPRYRLGSAPEIRFERASAAFGEATATVGGQEWVQGVKAEAKIGELTDARRTLAEKLQRGEVPQAQFEAEAARIDRRVKRYEAFMENLRLSDQGGYHADMLKKASHHMDPAHWCPPAAGFRCWEEPRQAAKAAQRILANIPEPVRTPEQRERLAWLKKIARGDEFLPVEAQANAQANARLREAIRQSFKEGFEFASGTDARYTGQLLDELKAARQAGDPERVAAALRKFDKQRTAASRIAATLEAVRQEHGGAELLHELISGEQLERTVNTAGEVRYRAVERFRRPDGTMGTRYKLLTPDQVAKTGREVIKRNIVRQWVGPGSGAAIPETPRFASFQHEPGLLDPELKGLKSMGKLGWLVVGATSVMSAHEATEQSAGQGRQVLSWTDIKNGNLTKEKIEGWAFTTALGTALAVGELTFVRSGARAGEQAAQAQRERGDPLLPGNWGIAEDTIKGTAHGIGLLVCQVTLVCPAGEALKGVYDSAYQEEEARAKAEGREPSRLAAMQLFVDKVNGQAWARERGKEIGEWSLAWLEAKRSEWTAGQMSREIADWMKAGGLERLLARLHTLREITNVARDLWEAAADAVTKAVFAAEDLEPARDRVRALASPQAVCEAILRARGAGGAAVPASERAAAWQRYLDERQLALQDLLGAAYELYGHASLAAATTEDTLLGADVLRQQEQLRGVMAQSLNRLQLSLPDDVQLAALQVEVQGMKEPIPIGNVPGTRKAALEYVQAADRAIAEVIALVKAGAECPGLGADTAVVSAPGPATPAPPPAIGVAQSIVILFDASGSMSTSDRIGQAKRSTVSVLRQVTAGIEVALIVFYDCNRIVVEQAFTTEPSRIEAILPRIRPSGSTPLAKATQVAKQYIADHASGQTARLVLLTDGQETCGGNPVEAARGR